MAKQELLATIRDHYRCSSKKDKTRILDEFIAITGHHRKHGIRLLGKLDNRKDTTHSVRGRRIYDEAVRETVIVIWEAADRICGKRLKAALPHLVDSMERHGHLALDPEIRDRLLAASAATLDRLLKPIRPTAESRRRRRRRQSMGKRIPVRTYNDWNGPPPGFLEIDLVLHCGGPLSGSFIHSLVATDICTGWTEAVPLLAKEQSLIVEGLEAIGQRLPFRIRGIDSDNDSAFINETLIRYCVDRGIEFTRSRAYRSNNQAWIEQKNGSVVRRFVGHDRYSGQVAGQTMAHLYGALRRYVNFFQPSFKLIDKTWDGATTVKRYSPPTTPCDRLIQHDATSDEMRAVLNEYRARLDPVLLLHTIREAQSALAALVPLNSGPHLGARAWNAFWPGCPTGGVRSKSKSKENCGESAAHLANAARSLRRGVVRRAGVVAGRSGRQRGGTAVPAARNGPDRFSRAHLRTLQRTVQEWRGIMAKKLVYATAGEPMAEPAAMPELGLVGGTPGATVSVTFLNQATGPQ